MRNSCQYKDKPRTFRRSSSKILPEGNRKNIGWGTNLQNIEKYIRSIYHPDGFTKQLSNKCKYWLETGDLSIFTEEELVTLRVMLQVDQSGAEALIMAYDCLPGAYRQLFENNIKPHVFVAMHLFKDIWPLKMKERGGVVLNMDELCNTAIPLLRQNPTFKELDNLIKDSDNWSIDQRYYYLAKQTCHSANYDIQWATFILNVLDKSGGKIILVKDQGEYFLKMYRSLFPEIPERNDRVRKIVDKYRRIYNMLGHPYNITAYNITEREYKELYAWGCQSTVGEITRTAFCDLQEFIEMNGLKWDILGDCHDSYLAQCPLAEVKECGAKMKEFMNIEMTSFDGVKFRMKSELQIGFNWGPYDKFNPDKNPLGLREINWKN